MGYTYPSHYPPNCPPPPHDGIQGTFYKVVKNMNKSDPNHFKSQYELHEMEHLEDTEACERRSVSILSSYDEAVRLSQQYQKKGKCIARIDLTNGHGVIHHTPNKMLATHHDWWIPIGIDPCICCIEIKERTV